MNNGQLDQANRKQWFSTSVAHQTAYHQKFMYIYTYLGFYFSWESARNIYFKNKSFFTKGINVQQGLKITDHQLT